LTVRLGRVLTLAGPEVGAEKMRLRLPIRGPRLSSVPGRHAVARSSACGGIFTRGDDRAASRAPPSSPPLSGAHAMRLADDRATNVLPGRRRLRQRHPWLPRAIPTALSHATDVAPRQLLLAAAS